MRAARPPGKPDTCLVALAVLGAGLTGLVFLLNEAARWLT